MHTQLPLNIETPLKLF